MVSEAVRGVERVYSTLISGILLAKTLEEALGLPLSGVPEVNLTFPSFCQINYLGKGFAEAFGSRRCVNAA